MRRVVWKQSAPWNSEVEFRLEPVGKATTVHIDFTGRPSGKIRWLDLVPDPLATVIYRNDMKTLTSLLDQRVSE